MLCDQVYDEYKGRVKRNVKVSNATEHCIGPFNLKYQKYQNIYKVPKYSPLLFYFIFNFVHGCTYPQDIHLLLNDFFYKFPFKNLKTLKWKMYFLH